MIVKCLKGECSNGKASCCLFCSEFYTCSDVYSECEEIQRLCDSGVISTISLPCREELMELIEYEHCSIKDRENKKRNDLLFHLETDP